ncbi:CHAT domain-containing protein [uncultured Dokdonia sp.]|uniref:CHAT domain-containing protein n=1 Tax=uncultured Dokdonia sp. TaxID=575653 RepID=UPI0026050EC6|nr:CHAT domain-containing protein [uncultured Dokdonia sp.]
MSQLKNILTIGVSLLVFTLYGQEKKLGFYDSILSLPVENSQKSKLIEQFLENQSNFDSLELASYYYEFSKWNWSMLKDKESAKFYAKKEYDLRKQIGQEKNLIEIKRNLYNLGYMHHYSKYPEYDNALAYFDTLITLTSQNESRLGNAYRERGDIYDKLGDFQRALENYSFSENIFKEIDRSDLQLKTLINISGTYVSINDSMYVDDFEKNLLKIQQIDTSLFSKKQKGMLLGNIGYIRHFQKRNAIALQTTEAAITLLKEARDTVHLFNSYNLLGVIYKAQKEYKKAEVTFTQAEKYSKKDPLNKSIIANNLADLYQEQGNLEKALNYYYKALQTIEGVAPNVHPDAYLTQENIAISPYKTIVFGYLNDLSNALIANYQKTRELHTIVKAKEIIALADALVDDIFLESREELSKLSWREKSSNLYLNGVYIAHELNTPDLALYYIEKNKGLVLLENITNVSARQKANIPSSVIDKEYRLLRSIKELETDLISGSSKTIDLTNKDRIKNEVFSLKRDYRALIDSLEQRYPAYFSYKQGLSIPSISEIRQDLEDNEVIVSYAVGDSLSYALLVTKETIVLQKLTISTPELTNRITTFRKQLERPFDKQSDRVAYQNNAKNLYDILFPFENKDAVLFDKRIFIIPDGNLHALPFEALSVSKELPLSASYFITKSEISYKYSLSVESQLQLLRPPEQKSIVGIIPSIFKDNYQEPLVQSADELAQMTPFLEDRLFTQESANKNAFMKAFEDHSIIHISTHGGVSTEGPWLALYDERLFLNELYFLKNQKDLVVLNACKTLSGKFQKGEGVFNLMRGFTNAGAKSVIGSLWNINEKSSLEITTQFYRNLKQGDRKSKALQKAKLTYLKNHANTSEASPYYWSAITLVGSDEALYDSFSYTKWLLFAGIAIIFFISVRMLILKFKR